MNLNLAELGNFPNRMAGIFEIIDYFSIYWGFTDCSHTR